MTFDRQKVAASTVVLVMAAALVLAVDRGGLIAWGTLVVAAGLLVKIWRQHTSLDLMLSVGLAVVPVLLWVATLNYVISTWESGEVVELAIPIEDGTHTVRLWVLDIGPHPLVYYDAEPKVAISLLAGKPLQFTRAGEVSTRIPKARRVETLTEDETNLILEAMATKYGDRNSAADLYYIMLGRAQDRISLIAEFIEQ